MSRLRLVSLAAGTFAALAVAFPHGVRAQVAAPPAFRNPDLPLEQRVLDLLSRLSTDEKVSLLIERAAPVERLGIPRFPWWNEGLHGVARAGRATVFPQAIGLAASWDAELMRRVASATSDEARAMHNRSAARDKRNLYQGLVFWSPNINIFRDPRWGRGQETYGEDPFLTATLGTAFVRGMQGDDARYLKTVATPKHYAVHSGPEPARHSFDAQVSESDLRETYLPAFRALVVDGKAASVMCSYNSFRGQPACANDELLGKVLRGQWGFSGYVVSDCGAVNDIYQGHKARKTAVEAAAMALRAGTDLECGAGSWAPGSPDSYETLGDAVKQGLVKEADLDRALGRLLSAQMRLGVYDPPERLPWAGYTYETVVNSPKHQELALAAARESIVLLKNDGNTLPLSPALKSIAVIGPNADDTEVLSANYNGTPVAPVSIRAGIEAALPGANVLHARGGPRVLGLPDLTPVPSSALVVAEGKEHGLRGEYYAGHFEGAPVLSRVDPRVDFDWADGAPAPGMDDDSFSVRWRGVLQVPTTGSYTLGMRCATSCRILLDGMPLAQGRSDHETATITGVVTLRAGRSYPIRLEMEHEKYDAIAQLLWQTPEGRGDERAEAVAAAQSADAVVLVLGLSAQLESEESSLQVEGFVGGDRTTLDLPKNQQALLEAVVAAAKGKPVVLVLINGSALAVNWADKNVPAIVEAWYPGQAGGTAVADVLFGKVSPAGRLPVTFYRSLDQLPPFEDYAMKGRTYRYFRGEPLYPFGHGLSYSRFAYAKLRVPAKAPVGARVLCVGGGAERRRNGGGRGGPALPLGPRCLGAGAAAGSPGLPAGDAQARREAGGAVHPRRASVFVDRYGRAEDRRAGQLHDCDRRQAAGAHGHGGCFDDGRAGGPARADGCFEDARALSGRPRSADRSRQPS